MITALLHHHAVLLRTTLDVIALVICFGLHSATKYFILPLLYFPPKNCVLCTAHYVLPIAALQTSFQLTESDCAAGELGGNWAMRLAAALLCTSPTD